MTFEEITELAKRNANFMVKLIGKDAAHRRCLQLIEYYKIKQFEYLLLFWTEVKKEIEGKNENNL